MSENSMRAAKPSDQADQSAAEFGSTIISVSPALRRFALRLTKDPSAADDLVQETLIRAWTGRLSFEYGSNARAWLFRIARNAFLSGLRRSRRQVAWDPVQHDLMLIQEPTQQDALHARDLQAALGRLPPAQRTAFRLVVQQEMSIAAAAAELSIASGTVKSRVSRARASVLAYIGGDGDGYGANDQEPLHQAVPRARLRSATMGNQDSAPDRHGSTRYQQWKVAGETQIG